MKADGKTRRVAQERDKGRMKMMTKDNIGNLPIGDVDAIITSPPYSEGEFDTKHGMKGSLSPNLRGRKVWENREKIPLKEGENIATLKHGKPVHGVCTCKIDGVLNFPSTAGFGWYSNFFAKASVAHSAKANLMLLRFLVEAFTKPGDVVLDPMAGTGSTLVMAADLGRNAIGVELEEKFCNWINDNIVMAKKAGVSGEMKVIKGDARNLTTLLKAGSVEGKAKGQQADNVITSPPYANSTAFEDIKFMKDTAKTRGEKTKTGESKGHYFTEEAHKRVFEKIERGRYEEENNIANLPAGDVDAIITSPPYSEGIGHDSGNNASEQFKERLDMQRKYTRQMASKGNIATLKHGDIDAIITSPPYANQMNAKSKGGTISPHMQGLISKLSGIPVKEFANDPERFMEAWKIARSRIPHKYSDNPNNIGDLPVGDIDAIITSPPYGERRNYQDIERSKANIDKYFKEKNINPDLYAEDPANINRLEHKEDIDAIITSPPYADAKKGGEANKEAMAERWDKAFKKQGETWNSWGKTWKTPGRIRALESLGSGYSASKENIGNLPIGDVDAIITSPPYESSMEGGSRHTGGIVEREKDPHSDTRLKMGLGIKYSDNEDNIGNLKKETYLEAMARVYREVYAVLKPGGRMILILKDFVRNKKIVLLHEHTIKLCELAGFRLEKHLKSKLPIQSFWRVLYKRKHTGVPGLDELNYEHVLVFVKPNDGI